MILPDASASARTSLHFRAMRLVYGIVGRDVPRRLSSTYRRNDHGAENGRDESGCQYDTQHRGSCSGVSRSCLRHRRNAASDTAHAPAAMNTDSTARATCTFSDIVASGVESVFTSCSAQADY